MISFMSSLLASLPKTIFFIPKDCQNLTASIFKTLSWVDKINGTCNFNSWQYLMTAKSEIIKPSTLLNLNILDILLVLLNLHYEIQY